MTHGISLESLQLLASLVLGYLVPALAIGIPVWWIARKETRLGWPEALLMLAPPLLWLGLVLTGVTTKTLSNLVELPALGLCAGLAFAFRCLAARRTHTDPPRWSHATLAVACLCTVILAVSIPALPE